MERRLVLRGLLAGLVAGLVAFIYARIVGEPLIAQAIDYESGRAAAAEALTHSAAGHSHGEEEIVSRGVQSGWGLAAGVIGYAVALGGIFSVVYAACLGRFQQWSPRVLALVLAGAGFVAINLVPFLRYPANPPAVSLEETARPRGGYYLLLVIASIAMLVLAVWIGRRVADRSTTVNGAVVGFGAWAFLTVLALLVFPSTGSMSGSGRAAETPLPLLDETGAIVFPGFPADLLYDFRLYSLGVHLLMWTVLGVVFGLLAERLLSHRPSTRTIDDVFSS
jgi:predicted cobalt transporter CbtA